MDLILRKKGGLLAAWLFCSALLPGCGFPGASSKGWITVGSKSFTEQLILGEITRLALENAGFRVIDRLGLAGTVTTRRALENGSIDLYWEYTGTAWLVAFGHPSIDSEADELFQKVRAEDDLRGLVWLPYAPFSNSFALMMTRADSERLAIFTLRDLARYVNQTRPNLVFATDHEFSARPDGLPALERSYGFQFDRRRLKVMDPGLTYQALRDGQVEVAMGFETDGRVDAFGLVVLEDDGKFFPAYNPAPVVRREVLERYPEIESILTEVARRLDTEAIRSLNFAVDGKRRRPEAVAANWLSEQGLIKP